MTLALPNGTEVFDTKVMKLNVDVEDIRLNVRRNIGRQLPQVNSFHPQDQRIAIVGGGWSLDDTLSELLDCVWQRFPIVALNGAGRWLLERNICPSILVIMDAKPENVRFLEDFNPPGCKYMLASQANPEVFDLCKGRETYIFHVCSSLDIEKPILDEYYLGEWVLVSGGSTVGLRAIGLMRTLGYQYMHLFGYDSCYAPDGRHHAYAQEMNDEEGSRQMWCAGREFRCAAWQASQSIDFRNFVRDSGELFKLNIHGDGLLAYIMRSGAEAVREEH